MIDRLHGVEPHPIARILAALLEARTGQIMAPNRFWRIETSLKPVLRHHNIPDLDALAAVISKVECEPLVQDVVEAMLNNESSFFRDAALFVTLQREVIDHIAKQKAKTRHLRIWSAGCATGQEPYSLAMLFAEEPERWHGWTIEIVASDISQSAIGKAESGVYSQFEIQRGLSAQRMLRHFQQTGSDWELRPDIRERVAFSRSNLLKHAPHRAPFDLLLCRNVLMYFSPEARHRAYARLASSISDDGVLVLGAAETVIGHDTQFRVSARFRGCYRRLPREKRDHNQPLAMLG
ncbi:CheR family methyltransferase [Alterisphingorhabdus coralli]|uniref:Protein-glutamate O-methyltransferase CheR n=1 Tax=Alterisphingorhabdus coralli TaxID=3071408 RepID=A0AA97I180_9SPHN|nr:protein-glutamate O-methyltransferase CheR [Parasphingorhabdus sp. SCSIO 66989]WOE76459.1 protein-glutamate O-methyltransferase CheR [Parasphingorhabdus sp. SCSIO 66989]